MNITAITSTLLQSLVLPAALVATAFALILAADVLRQIGRAHV